MSVYWRARTLLKHRLVIPESIGMKSIFFVVRTMEDKTYEVKKSVKGWSCTCEFMSHWKGESERLCYHCKACELYLEAHKI